VTSTEAASAGATGPEAATVLAAASDRGPSPAPSLAADRAPELGAAPSPHYPPEQSVVPILAGAAILAVGVGLLGSALLVFLGLATMLTISFIWGWERWPEMEISAREGERFGRLSIGMLVFLASEAVLFGSLIYAYIHLRLHAITWPPEGMEPLDVGFPAFNTGVLIASGVVAHYALEAYRKGKLVATRVLLVVTIVLGAAFLGGQAYEYGIVGFGLSDGLMGSTFFTLTGFHGAHVTGGLLILVAMYLRTVRDNRAGLAIPDRGSGDMMAAGTYYWHFVDAVWVVLFFVVYLL
jgi:cytochrome c oxidase subunit 3